MIYIEVQHEVATVKTEILQEWNKADLREMTQLTS